MVRNVILFLSLLFAAIPVDASFVQGGDFGLFVAEGKVTGYASVNKFGENIEIDSGVTADMWDGGYTVASGGVSLIWVAPTAARTHTIASTDANDTSGGTGARTVQIYGLTDWNTAEVNETVTMNTGSPPVTSNSYVIIHRMKVLTKGASGPNVGVITATATTDATVTAQINAGQGQTQMLIYGIPSVQTLYVSNIAISANKAGGASGLIDCSFMFNPEPGGELTTYLTKDKYGLQTVGSSDLTIPYNPHRKFAGPGILKVQCDSGTNDMDVSGKFDGFLVTN